jgi:LysM repeat protein
MQYFAKGVKPVASTIGIKIANGEFYSIVEENASVKKRLVLTTVHDKQRSVQIDLYKSVTKTMADALYIGSLVVENIKPKSKGEPSIELVISSNSSGEIKADALDLDSSSNAEHHYLTVSLKSLDDDNRDYNIPDFELEQHEHPPRSLYGKAAAVESRGARKIPWLPIILIGLVLAAICLALWFFIFKDKESSQVRESSSPAASSSTAQTAPVQTTPVQTAPAQTTPVQTTPVQTTPIQTTPASPIIQAPAAAQGQPAARKRDRPEPPVASYKVPAVIPRGGVPYTIRWGDTLWDISEAFYRNPWLYPRIARFNNIRNPDRIIAGTTIRIPPRN